MRMFACVLAVVVLGGAAARAAEDKDQAKFQGTWTFTAHEMDGKATPEADLKKMTITFAGDKFAVKMDGQVVQAGTQKLDSSKKPSTVDAVVTEGEGKGTTMLGIYEISGDTVKFCFDPTGKKRPTALKGGPGLDAGTLKKAK